MGNSMRLESWVFIVVYILTTVLLFFIPKNKLRLAVVAFLFKQILTFSLGLIVVEIGLLEYPVRIFPSVSRASFTYEYYAYPVTCAIFNVWYPTKRNIFIQLGYYAAFCSVLTFGEVLIEKYTDILTYVHWNWYITWISLFLTFFLTRLFCIWFFKKESVKH
ncbi:CBO0543 family protein [Fredinandcohnia sp. 179-A 10B2 NHS]|uniref:CBO0543 family protein n=1 Tax=Fredinandcohnia sp. 179-A 10B2 NHS TaxID=3235176 RepID=UPI0039A35BF6